MLHHNDMKNYRTPINSKYNPLDDLEELLEASLYEYHRETKTRLQFVCGGKQGDYDFILEWNSNYNAIKCSVIIKATKKTPRDMLEKAINLANDVAWKGFFVMDGVGNSVFRSLVKLDDKTPSKILILVEDAIDNAISEADRFCISLALSNDNEYQELFPDEDWSLDNLTLMFSDVKGNA